MRAGGGAGVGVRGPPRPPLHGPRVPGARPWGGGDPGGRRAEGEGDARLRRAPLVHPAAPVHLALGEPGLGEGRALRSAAAGGGRAPPSAGEVLEVRGRGPAPRGSSPASARPLPGSAERGRGRRARAWVSGLHPHTPLALPRASPAPGAGPALRPHKLVPLLCRVLLELVPQTPRFFPLPTPRFGFREGRRGFFSSCDSHQVSCPRGGLGCPLWQEVGPGAPAWRCMWSGCAVSRACRLCAPPPRPSSWKRRPTTARPGRWRRHPHPGVEGARVLTCFPVNKVAVCKHSARTSILPSCCVTLGYSGVFSGLFKEVGGTLTIGLPGCYSSGRSCIVT